VVSNFASRSFVFFKATEGLSFIDPHFAANWRAAKAAGMHRGAYHYFHPSESAVGQATLFLETVAAQGLDAGDILVADIEITAGADGKSAYSSRYAAARSHVQLALTALPEGAANSGGQIFQEACHTAFGSHNPILTYTNESVGHTLTSLAWTQLWIAFPSATAPTSIFPWKSWKFWQWQFGGGPDGGDQDAYAGTEAEMQDWLNKFVHTDPPGGPQRQVAPGNTTLAEVARNRHTTVDHLYHETMAHVNSRNYDKFEKYCGALYPKYHHLNVHRNMPAGLVYYVGH
jgi:GH25 family lysozyme M1 (1,4-beta-N-acetylmuramidase)